LRLGKPANTWSAPVAPVVWGVVWDVEWDLSGYLLAIKLDLFNGNSRILNWRYVSTIFLAIFCGDIPEI
jgi:hypothetical protein